MVICEDNEYYLNYLETTLLNVIKKQNIKAKIIFKAQSTIELANYLEKIHPNEPNVFFLDIQLEKNDSGYEIAHVIRNKFTNSYIIFISERADFVFKTFKVKPFNFLPKPVSEQEIKECLLDIDKDYQIRNSHEDELNLIIKSGCINYTLKTSELIYIEKIGNKIILYSLNNTISAYDTLENIMEKLINSDNFVRCHKSYIANKNFFSQIHRDSNEIIFKNGMKCYIGRKYKKLLFDNQ